VFKKQVANADLPAQKRIATVATALFAARGYNGVSLRAIATAAGVPVGLIPYHFGSKAGLYRALWEFWMGTVPAELLLRRRPRPTGASREARLRSVVRAFFEGPRRLLLEPGGARFVAIMVREAHDPSAASRGLVREFIRPNALRFRAELARTLPGIEAQGLGAAFEMMVSALRIVIERQPGLGARVPDASKVEKLVDVLTEFVVGGCLRLLGRYDNPG
jgi:AcrR family transcriptional regulator